MRKLIEEFEKVLINEMIHRFALAIAGKRKEKKIMLDMNICKDCDCLDTNQNGYYCQCVDGCEKSRTRYEVYLQFNLVFENEETGELKTANELAGDLANMICDEVATAGGVGGYTIILADRTTFDGKKQDSGMIVKMLNDFFENVL